MMRLLSLTAVSVFALGGLTACGGDDFCDQVSSTSLNAVGSNPEDVFKAIDDIAGSAPDELKDDFDVVQGLGDKVVDDPASLSPDDVTKYTDALTNIGDYVTAECN